MFRRAKEWATLALETLWDCQPKNKEVAEIDGCVCVCVYVCMCVLTLQSQLLSASPIYCHFTPNNPASHF
jgi:hypothetical protein